MGISLEFPKREALNRLDWRRSMCSFVGNRSLGAASSN